MSNPATESQSRRRSNLRMLMLFIAGAGLTLSLTLAVQMNSAKKSALNSAQPVAQSDQDTQLADPFAGWMTYSNPEFRYALRYPGDWNQGEMDLGTEKLIVLTPAPVDQIGMQVDAISVSASTNTKNVTAQEYYEQMVLPSQAGSMCESPTLKTDLPPSLQGLDVVIAEGLCGVLNQGPRAIIAHNGYMYMLSSGFTGEVDAQLVYKVLSSLAFLD